MPWGETADYIARGALGVGQDGSDSEHQDEPTTKGKSNFIWSYH